MRVDLTCTVCGTAYSRYPSQAGLYCSNSCRKQGRSAAPAPEFSSDGLTARIPLMAHGNRVVGHATVDASDAAWASQWRWNLNNNGYAARDAYRPSGIHQTVLLHRELLGLKRGDGLEGDHKNLDRLDNRRSNLRPLPSAGRPNLQNKSSYRGSTSKHRGVSYRSSIDRWVAQVQMNGKSVFQRTYHTEQEAADAARAARLKFLPYTMD